MISLPIRIGMGLVGLILASVALAQEADGPRLGKYDLYQGNVTTVYFHLLPGNKYKVFDRINQPLGEGDYRYDPKDKLVRWQSGRFKDVGYGGTFSIQDNGQTHVLRMGVTSYAYNKGK